jgi:hypothetical protein
VNLLYNRIHIGNKARVLVQRDDRASIAH